MSTVINGTTAAPSSGGWLSKERTIVGAGYNRWMVPPAALLIHLCIGMAYGLSTFWLPLSKAIGLKSALACPKDTTFWQELFVSSCDWKVGSLVWIFTLGIVFLGASAALFGGWLEHVGPRKAGVVSAVCWAGGLVVTGYGVHIHQLWLMLVGGGLIGGVGLGIGYISPVSTLIKWFPDRRGMATGLAIMGFGGGAMVGSPLAALLIKSFATDADVGVEQTLYLMAGLYFLWMLLGAFSYRVPATGWTPAGWTAPAAGTAKAALAPGHVHASKVWGIPQFWLVWVVLCMNVSAGIGILAMASPMIQDVFGGHLIGLDVGFTALTKEQLAKTAVIGASFVGLLSLFNIGGRFFWASLSDVFGRKVTYAIFFVLGIALYLSVPASASAGNKLAFVASFCVILSMYGGGFATVPAYLSDLFGTQMVGAIHGRLLTAWSTAGLVGVLIAMRRDAAIASGMEHQLVYNGTMYILAGMLVVGLVANLLIKPIDTKWFMSEAELAEEKRLAHERFVGSTVNGVAASQSSGLVLGLVGWIAVLVPLLWGLQMTLKNVSKFFN